MSGERGEGDFGKAVLLFTNFFLIILIYTIVRPVRNALVVTQLGAQALPYLWIATAACVGVFVTIYGRVLDLVSRRWILSVTISGFFVLLLAIHCFLGGKAAWPGAVFYVWGDVFSVVMMEQFWSLTNDTFDATRAKRWYGFIGAGAVIGGFVGSILTSFLVHKIGTVHLVFICEALIVVLFGTAFHAQSIRKSVPKVKVAGTPGSNELFAGFKLVGNYPYLSLLLLFVVLTEVITNVIDFQFNTLLQEMHPGMDQKTAFLANVNLAINIISVSMTLFFASPIHRRLGVLGGLLVLPLSNFIGAALLILFPVPMILIGLKCCSKGFDYSIHRVSKEMLYIPTPAEVKYKAKAVIDMFGYRVSELVGSLLLLPFIALIGTKHVNFMTIALEGCVLGIVIVLVQYYQGLQAGTRTLDPSLEPEPSLSI